MLLRVLIARSRPCTDEEEEAAACVWENVRGLITCSREGCAFITHRRQAHTFSWARCRGSMGISDIKKKREKTRGDNTKVHDYACSANTI